MNYFYHKAKIVFRIFEQVSQSFFIYNEYFFFFVPIFSKNDGIQTGKYFDVTRFVIIHFQNHSGVLNLLK
jgi:hypothetical protein